MKSLDPATQAQITEMIESDPRFQNASEEFIEVEEGSIDQDLKEYGTTQLAKECAEDLQKRGLLDLVYNEQTGQLEPEKISFYTKAGAFLQDSSDIVAKKIADEFQSINGIKDIDEKINKLHNLSNSIDRYSNNIQEIISRRIDYHHATFQMALVNNSWKFAAVFKAIGNLSSWITPKARYFYASNPNAPIQRDLIFGLALNISTDFYQRAINKKLEPTEYADFAALTMEDIYSLANFMVPGLCAMLEFIRSDVLAYTESMIPGINPNRFDGQAYNLISREISDSINKAYDESYRRNKNKPKSSLYIDSNEMSDDF